MLARHSLLGLLLLTFAPACGGDVAVETGGGTSSSSGGSGGTSTSSSSTSSTSSITGTGGAGGGDTVCAGFGDEESSGTLTIRVINESDEHLYIPASCSTERLNITSVPPNDVSYPGERSCTQTCEELQTQPQYVCGACAPLAYRILPGAQRDIPWDGKGLRSRTMPQECWEGSSFNEACQQLVAAKPG